MRRVLENTRHRRYLSWFIYSLGNKDGVDQLIYPQMGLAHQATQFFILSCTAHTHNWKCIHCSSFEPLH
jgi:hypothetical protein